MVARQHIGRLMGSARAATGRRWTHLPPRPLEFGLRGVAPARSRCSRSAREPAHRAHWRWPGTSSPSSLHRAAEALDAAEHRHGGAAGEVPPSSAGPHDSLALPALYLFVIVIQWTPPHIWALRCYARPTAARGADAAWCGRAGDGAPDPLRLHDSPASCDASVAPGLRASTTWLSLWAESGVSASPTRRPDRDRLSCSSSSAPTARSSSRGVSYASDSARRPRIGTASLFPGGASGQTQRGSYEHDGL